MPFRDKGAVMLDLQGRIVFTSTYVSDLLGVDFDKITLISSFQKTWKRLNERLRLIKSRTLNRFDFGYDE